MAGKPKNVMQREQWAQVDALLVLDQATDLIRYIENALPADGLSIEICGRIWALFGATYAAGQLNPLEPIQGRIRSGHN